MNSLYSVLSCGQAGQRAERKPLHPNATTASPGRRDALWAAGIRTVHLSRYARGRNTNTHSVTATSSRAHSFFLSLSHTSHAHLSSSSQCCCVDEKSSRNFFFFFFNYHADTFNNCVNSLQKAPQFVENNTKLDSTLKKKKEAVQIVTRFVLRI